MQGAKLRFHDAFAGGWQRNRIGRNRQQRQPGFALLPLFIRNADNPVAHRQPVGGQVHILLPQRQQFSLGKPRGKGKTNQVAPLLADSQQLLLFHSGKDELFPVRACFSSGENLFAQDFRRTGIFCQQPRLHRLLEDGPQQLVGIFGLSAGQTGKIALQPRGCQLCQLISSQTGQNCILKQPLIGLRGPVGTGM